jgi:hypothetical protein
MPIKFHFIYPIYFVDKKNYLAINKVKYQDEKMC